LTDAAANASQMARCVDLPRIGAVCRLGLATRGNTHLDEDDVWYAFERGVNYWNWCGHEDGLAAAARNLGKRRRDVVLAVQLDVQTADDASRAVERTLRQLGTDYIDVVTYYYVQSRRELEEILAHAHPVMRRLAAEGVVRAIGMTTHNRKLAAWACGTGELDLLMVRFNPAHTGARRDVLPVALEQGIPVVAFTVTRWGQLLRPIRARPGLVPLSAVECLRYVLAEPGVSVALSAPNGRAELEQNLSLLEDWRPLSPEERCRVEAFGQELYKRLPRFP